MQAASATGAADPILSFIRYSPVIASDDAVDLRWFFREGMRIYGSRYGCQWEQQAKFFRSATPCTWCGGDPDANDPGCGFVEDTSKKPPKWLAKTEELEPLYRAVLRNYRELRLPVGVDKVCPRCKGRGWIVRRVRRARHDDGEITARPTGSSKHTEPGGISTGDVELHRHAVMCKRLMALEELIPGASYKLAAYYGPDRGDGGGDLVCLWPFTAAGKTMLRGNRVKGLDPLRYLANERASEETSPNEKKRAQFRAADAQARELLMLVGRAWNKARGSRPRWGAQL